MIQDENDWCVQWDVFDSRNFDTLEVDPQRESDEGNYEAANHFVFELGPLEENFSAISAPLRPSALNTPYGSL
jgi:hypothetical protein